MNALTPEPTKKLLRLLNSRYGDGTVYVPSGESPALYYSCMERGYISEDGFITRQGRELATRYLS